MRRSVASDQQEAQPHGKGTNPNSARTDSAPRFAPGAGCIHGPTSLLRFQTRETCTKIQAQVFFRHRVNLCSVFRQQPAHRPTPRPRLHATPIFPTSALSGAGSLLSETGAHLCRYPPSNEEPLNLKPGDHPPPIIQRGTPRKRRRAPEKVQIASAKRPICNILRTTPME